jgi:hypothetical protein
MIDNTPSAAFDIDRILACYEALKLTRRDRKTHGALRERLLGLPLWRTVQGQTVTGAELAGRDGPILVVSDQTSPGSPVDGRFIVRAAPWAIDALAYVGGVEVERHDAEWEEELAGQARRMSAAQVSPALSNEVVAQIYFQNDATSGLLGLLRPRPGALGDDTDPASLVRLHVDRRSVGRREPTWHPAVEAWVNDDRLEPTRSFLDVVQDDNLSEVLATVRDRIPELVLRATEQVDLAQAVDPLRMRLGAYVLDRLDELGGISADEPHPLLEARIWRTLTPDGLRLRSTVELGAAHGAGHLAYADPAAFASAGPAGWTIAYVVAPEVERFQRAFEGVTDYSERLEKLSLHRRFMSRQRVRAVRLEDVISGGSPLLTHPLTDQGWEGELGIMAERGSIMTVHIFVDHRHLATHEIVAPVRAVVAAQFSGVTPNDSFDDIEQDDGAKEMVRELREELWHGLVLLAGRLDQLRSFNRIRARLVLLDAIARRRGEQKKGAADPVLKGLEAAPLLPDPAGRLWSIEAIRKAAPRKVRAIAPATAKRGMPLDDDAPVLVLDDAQWPAVNEVIPLQSFNERYLQEIEARERRERAPTSHRFSRRKSLVLEEVEDGAVHGELGLARDLEDGGVGLFHDGRLVEVMASTRHPGMVGALHGDWRVDRDFTRVSLSREHRRALDRLYLGRLEAAAAEAAASRRPGRGRSWDALAGYTVRYLARTLARAAGNQEQRRDRVLTRDQVLDEAVRRALDARVIETNDGDWIDLPTLIAGEDPVVVLCPSRVRRPPKSDAVLVREVEELADVVAGLIGSENVLDEGRWRDKLRASKKKKAKKDKQLSGEERDRRMGSRLRSLLREAVGKSGGQLTLRAIGKLDCRPLEDCDDLVRVDKTIFVNTDHSVWKEAVDAPVDARALFHLAAAVLTELSWGDDAMLASKTDTAWNQLVDALGRLAAHASNR